MRPRAILVAVQRQNVDDEAHASSIRELGQLGKTLGYEIVACISQKRAHLAHDAVVGKGKLLEVAAWTGGTGIVPSSAPVKKQRNAPDEPEPEPEPESESEPEPAIDAVAPDQRATIVLVDHDITPSQARNLEKATGAEVLDRTAVILEIFHRHARTREARLQVEAARLAYMAPRLRESGGGQDRARGGIGGKGAGESAMELDRRKVRDRIAELRREIDAISQDSGTRRSRRAQEPTVALVGYTNAGKSSLMRALTGSDVLVEDKLFATLDTTIRVIKPETRPRILATDTVGFIKKLPHGLVASFRSTLEEARDADLQLHVVDAADPAFPAQIEVTRQVLSEIDAGDVPRLLLLNKIDRVDTLRQAELASSYPEAILLSAKRPTDIAALRDHIVAFFERDMIEAELIVPWSQAGLVAETHAACRVLSETHDAFGTLMRVRALPETIEKLRKEIGSPSADPEHGPEKHDA
jgi:GTPase